MDTVLIVIYLLIVIALIVVVLMQRSEGGALGIGGGGGGGLMTGRGAANMLTRITAGLATAFIVMSIVLAMRADTGTAPSSVTEQPVTEDPAVPTAPADGAPTAPTD